MVRKYYDILFLVRIIKFSELILVILSWLVVILVDFNIYEEIIF